MTYNKSYLIYYSFNNNPQHYKYKSYNAWKSMLSFISKNIEQYDYVKPLIIIEWNSLQDLSFGTSFGSITHVGQQQNVNIRIMENANAHVKKLKQLELNL